MLSVSLKKVIDELQLVTIVMPEDPDGIMISRNEVTRPALALTGFYGRFEPGRIQIIGNAEAEYLAQLDDKTRHDRMSEYMSRHPVAVVYAHGNKASEDDISLAEYFGVPMLESPEDTSSLMASTIAFLNVSLAPRITRHGVLVEVYGEGILMLGDSGVGKSETAIELIKRGHRLIADDAVEIKKVSAKTLVGSAPEIIRHYIELRGIGIVDVRRIFGMGAVKETEKIDMIIKLEPWVQGKMYDRLGLDSEFTDIMGISIPTTTIPVRPGRNLAIIMEIAAMNNRQKKMGYNTAEEFNKKLLGMMDEGQN